MALLGSLNTGASGVKTHGKSMQIIGNNIANVNTFGSKATKMHLKKKWEILGLRDRPSQRPVMA